MNTPQFEQRIAAVRRFSRFYTRQLGLLQESLVHTRFSLTEARVLYELAHREQVTASELAADLDLDHGYLSRILRRFGDEGLLKKVRAANDGRQSVISITAKGRKAFAPLNKNSHDQVAAMLEKMSEAEQSRVIGAMASIESLLSPSNARPEPIILRPHRAGDMGWVTSAHGAIYAQEYGWDITFEALVARSPPSSSRTSTPSVSAAGSPKWTASAWDRRSLSERRTRWRSCVWLSSIPRRAVWGSASALSTNACALRKARGTNP